MYRESSGNSSLVFVARELLVIPSARADRSQAGIPPLLVLSPTTIMSRGSPLAVRQASHAAYTPDPIPQLLKQSRAGFGLGLTS